MSSWGRGALVALLVLVKTVGNGGGGRFVDDAHDVKTGNGTRILNRGLLHMLAVWLECSYYRRFSSGNLPWWLDAGHR